MNLTYTLYLLKLQNGSKNPFLDQLRKSEYIRKVPTLKRIQEFGRLSIDFAEWQVEDSELFLPEFLRSFRWSDTFQRLFD